MAAPKRVIKSNKPLAFPKPVVEKAPALLNQQDQQDQAVTMDDKLMQALEQSDQALTTPHVPEPAIPKPVSPPPPAPKTKVKSKPARPTVRWFLVYLLTLTTVATLAFYGWQTWLEPRLERLETRPLAQAPMAAPVMTMPTPPLAAEKSEVDTFRQELQQLRESLKNPPQAPEPNAVPVEIQDLRANFKTQQQELATLKASLKTGEEKLSAALAQLKTGEKSAGSPPAVISTSLPSDPSAAEKAEKLLPSGELQVIKERNRLTAYADEAIALASRDAYESLWRAMKDPALTRLRDGAMAEILRVRTMFFSSSRLGNYPLPLAELYPAATPANEAALTVVQLGEMVMDGAKDWRIRAKAAQLLGRRPSMEACDALAKALETEKNLEVLKECQFAFEENTGFRAEILDYTAGPAWWKEHREEFLKRAQEKAAAAGKAPPAAP